jgi:glutathione peroxidase-family protein
MGESFSVNRGWANKSGKLITIISCDDPQPNDWLKEMVKFSKIDVKGSNQSPLYTYLTEEAQNGVESNKVAWNFQKYIIGKNGKLIKSYSPPTSVFDPEFIKAVELALN